MGVSIFPGRGGVAAWSPEVMHNIGDTAPVATDRDGIGLAQQKAASGNFLLNGAGVSGGAFDCGFDGGRKITLYSAGNISARTVTITGTDYAGAAQVETIAGPNNTTVTSTNYFKTVTQVSVNGAVGTNLEIGFSASYVVLNLARGSHFRLVPEAGETLQIAIKGEAGEGSGLKSKCSLKIFCNTNTVTWAAGICSHLGTMTTPTDGGQDYFEFMNDGATSGNPLWYCTLAMQDLR